MIRDIFFLFFTFLFTCSFLNGYGQDIDSLDKYVEQGELDKLEITANSLLSRNSRDQRALYYLSVSFGNLKSVDALYKTDSILNCCMVNTSVWKDRTHALRLSFMRKNEAYKEVIQEAYLFMSGLSDIIARTTLAHVLSISYRKLNRYDSALKWAIELEKLALDQSDKLLLHRALQNKANLYDALNERDKTIIIEKQLLQIADDLNNKDLQILDRCNLGSSYTNLNMLDSASYFYSEALTLAEASNNLQRIPLVLYNIASLEEERENYPIVISTLQKCLLIAEDTYQPSIISLSYFLLAKSFYKLDEQENYKKHLELGYNVAKEYNFLQDRLYFLELEFEVANQSDNLEYAIDIMQNIRALEDSILNNEKIRAIEELETKYETEKKNKEIELLTSESQIQQLVINQQRAIIIAVLAIILILAIFLYLFFRQRNLKKNLRLINTENKLLRTQMNPHFLSNALSAIQQFIYQKKDPFETADYLGRFSRLTRMILDYSQEENITLQQELDFLDHYLKLQQLRFDKPFEYTITDNEITNKDYVLIPPMITQPFLENSIEHGILQKETGGKIEIGFVLNEQSKYLSIIITDNGIGREKAAFNEKNSEHKSQATRITFERFATLEKKYRQKTLLEISDIEDKSAKVIGTKVLIQLPFLKKKYSKHD